MWWVFYSFQDSEAQRSCSEICPAAVARGDHWQPPEPKSRDLHEAPTPTDGLRVMAELARAALQAKAGGGGGEPEGKEVEGQGAGPGEGTGGHKAVPSGCYHPRAGGKGGRTGPRGAPIRSPFLPLGRRAVVSAQGAWLS